MTNAAKKKRADQNSRYREFRLDGREYHTLKEYAGALGISYWAADKRLDRGWTEQEMAEGIRAERKEARLRKELSKVASPRRRDRTVVIGHQTYESLRQAYDVIRPKISFAGVRARIRSGDTPAEALGVLARSDGRRRPKARKIQASRVLRAIVHLGVEYPNISRLASAHGLPDHVVRGRLKQGWTVERAVSEPPQDTSVTVCGVKYRSTDQAWEQLGKAPYSTFVGRRSKRLPLEVCLGLEPLPPRMRYQVKGKSYRSLADVADAYSIPLTTLRQRVRLMSLEKALAYVPRMGRYSPAVFKRDPALARKSAYLYFASAELVHGTLYKIGITVLSASQRLAAVDHRILALYRGQLSEIYDMEQRVLKRFHEFRSRANDGFDGKTETLRLSDRQVRHVLEYLEIAARRCGCEKVDRRGARGRPRS